MTTMLKLTAIALSVGLASSVALGEDNAGSGPRSDTSGTIEPKISTNDFEAVVNGNGSLARGIGVASVSHTVGSGTYVVSFKGIIKNCAFNATIGLSGQSGTETPGTISVVGAAINPKKGVFVKTTDVAGANSDRGFHLIVGC